MLRQYLKFEGGTNSDPAQNKVLNVVTLGATNHGTTLLGIGTLDREIRRLSGIDVDPVFTPIVGAAGIQQVYDSPLLQRLNAGGDTQPGIRYTVIATRYDQVTNPHEWTYLTPGPGATVRNVLLQDGCRVDLSDHLSMSYSPRAIDITRQALDPTTPITTRCEANAPVFGARGTYTPPA